MTTTSQPRTHAHTRTAEFHPEAGVTPGQIRWVMAANPFATTGRVLAAPAGFAELLAQGVLTSAEVCAFGVVTQSEVATLQTQPAQTQQVQRIAALIRTWLTRALATPDQWQIGAAVESTLDTQLAKITTELLAGEIGAYATRHGGKICFNCVQDGVVHVSMQGACKGCPAAVFSLQLRLAKRIREANPALVSVVDDAA